MNLPPGLSLQTLEEFEDKVPRLIDQFGATSADLWLKAYTAKRRVVSTEAKAFIRASSKEYRGKPLSVAAVNHYVELDPEVGAAHAAYAEVEGMRRKIDSKLEALHAFKSLLPGLRGTKNVLLQDK